MHEYMDKFIHFAYYSKCNFPTSSQVRCVGGRLDGLSVIMSEMNLKSHFQAPIGALVTIKTHAPDWP